MAPKKFTYTPGTGGGKRTKEMAKRGAASKSKTPAWTPPKQPTITTRKESADVVATSKYGTKYKPQAPGAQKSVLQRIDQLGGGAADFVFPEKTAGKIVKRQPLDAEDYVALAAALPLPGAKGLKAIGKGLEAAAGVAKPAAKAGKAAGQGFSVPRPSTRPGKSITAALEDIAKKGGQGKRPRIPGDMIKRQRIASLEKMLKSAPAEQRPAIQASLDALKPPVAATKKAAPPTIPPTKGVTIKTEATPGRGAQVTPKRTIPEKYQSSGPTSAQEADGVSVKPFGKPEPKYQEFKKNGVYGDPEKAAFKAAKKKWKREKTAHEKANEKALENASDSKREGTPLQRMREDTAEARLKAADGDLLGAHRKKGSAEAKLQDRQRGNRDVLGVPTESLMMPNVGRGPQSVRTVSGRNEISYAEAKAYDDEMKSVAASIKAKEKADKAAIAERGDKSPTSKGMLITPQTLEDATSKFPIPRPKLGKAKTDRAKKIYENRLKKWETERDAWRAKNTPERFKPRPKAESPLSKPAPAKTAEDAVPQRPADSKFKSSKKKGDPRLSSEDYELRVFTNAGKRYAEDVPYQDALNKLTGKTPLDYTPAAKPKPVSAPKKASAKNKSKAKPAEVVEETPTAPKRTSGKKATPKVEKPADNAPQLAVPEAPTAPAVKTPSAKKPKPAKAAEAETPTPSKAPSRKPRPKKEEPLPERPADSKFKSKETPASKRDVGFTKAGTRYVSDLKAQKALDARINSKPAASGAKVKTTKRRLAKSAAITGGIGATGITLKKFSDSDVSPNDVKSKGSYQAGANDGRLSRLTLRKARAEQAAAEAKPKKKFGAAGESKFLKGRSAVRQSVIDQITKQGMTKSLAAVKSRKNDPEYIEAIRRFYGAKRLKEALKG